MTERGVIEIHTSDRQTFKRCRRKFGWQSTLRDNLVRKGPDQKAFFLGTGFHFAMEDYWGKRQFSHPALAFAAYYDAQKPEELPDEAENALQLATGMLSYYTEEWLIEHPEEFETLVIDGKPQVEVEVYVNLNDMLIDHANEDAMRRGQPDRYDWLQPILDENDVIYVCTFDRVVIDRYGRIWGLDYKTAENYDELTIQSNPQSGAYNWAMNLFYRPFGLTPEGIIWQQHRKLVPHEPKLVYAGTKKERLSIAENQATTWRMFKRAVKRHHGGEVPAMYHEYLTYLAEAQDERGDRYIRRDLLRLNDQQREAEQRKILAETLDMLDPELDLYPNPTKDCAWDCPFKVPCLALDDGGDYEHLLSTEYEQWQGYKDSWRKRVKYPKAA